MFWNVIIDWDECPFIEWYDYSDNICYHENNRDKPCNKENCPIRNDK